MGRERIVTWLLGALVACVALAMSLPMVFARVYPYLSPDVVNYLGTANALAHGSGFVDPVQWHGFLAGAPPQPAWAILSPVICVALAVPVALGASVVGVIATHAALAALIAGATVLVARRFMSAPAAFACGAGLGWSAAWAQVSFTPLTEPYATLAILLVVWAAPGVARSHRGALLCAGATVVGWMARANVPLLAVAVVLAALWGRPLRAGIADRRLWTYVASVAGAMLALRAVYTLASGVAPYANYDAFFEMLQAEDLMLVDKQYVGGRAFAVEHGELVVARWRQWSVRVFEQLVSTSANHRVGFILPVVVTLGIFGRARVRPGHRDGEHTARSWDLQRRVAAFGALGFLASTILAYGGFEGRYVLPSATCLWLAGAASVDELAHRARARWGRTARFAPMVVVVVVVAVFAATTAPSTGARSWRKWRADEEGDFTRLVYRRGVDGQLRKLCASMDPAFVAASTHAEALHFWCGNPVMRLPLDVDRRRNLRRFIGERRVRYIVVDKDAPTRARIKKAGMLRVLKRTSDLELYEVRDFAAAPAWRPPPPLACLGDHPMCPRPAR